MTHDKDKALEQKLERQEKNERKRRLEHEKEERYNDLPENIYHKLYR
jgi:hypothetical protein